MELLLHALVIIAALVSIIANIVFCLKLFRIQKIQESGHKEISEILNCLIENLGETDEKVVHLSNDVDRSLLALKSEIEAQFNRNAEKERAQLRENNWDSIRNAFKGPTRIEMNERA